MYNKNFLNQNFLEKRFNLRPLYSILNKIEYKFQKTLVIFFIVSCIPLLSISCKTCKCPAYSQIISENPNKIEDSIT